MRKVRADSALGHLPEGIREQLYHLCQRPEMTLDEVVHEIGRPPEEDGLGIKTSRTALSV